MTQLDDRLRRRHLKLGWYGLVVFSSLGLTLEILHAFKLGFYLDVGAETRRLLWRLAHAHGALLALVNLAFAVTLPYTDAMARRRVELASVCIASALVLLPLGFFLGGSFARAGDPGVGVLLVPVGALLLVLGASLSASSAR